MEQFCFQNVTFHVLKLYLLIGNNLTAVINTTVLTEVRIMGDGNCFFTAVAVHLSNLMSAYESTEISVRRRLASIGLLQTMNMQEIADHLRGLVVKEWRERADEYASFLPENMNYFAEVSKFENPRFFTSPLGDHMPKAMSNVLGMPLRIIGSEPNTPALCVSPSASIDSPVQITLAYDSNGPGHYNATIFK